MDLDDLTYLAGAAYLTAYSGACWDDLDAGRKIVFTRAIQAVIEVVLAAALAAGDRSVDVPPRLER